MHSFAMILKQNKYGPKYFVFHYLFIYYIVHIHHSFIPPEKGGGVEDFGSIEIGGGFALMSGF